MAPEYQIFIGYHDDSWTPKKPVYTDNPNPVGEISEDREALEAEAKRLQESTNEAVDYFVDFAEPIDPGEDDERPEEEEDLDPGEDGPPPEHDDFEFGDDDDLPDFSLEALGFNEG